MPVLVGFGRNVIASWCCGAGPRAEQLDGDGQSFFCCARPLACAIRVIWEHLLWCRQTWISPCVELVRGCVMTVAIAGRGLWGGVGGGLRERFASLSVPRGVCRIPAQLARRRGIDGTNLQGAIRTLRRASTRGSKGLVQAPAEPQRPGHAHAQLVCDCLTPRCVMCICSGCFCRYSYAVAASVVMHMQLLLLLLCNTRSSCRRNLAERASCTSCASMQCLHRVEVWFVAWDRVRHHVAVCYSW